MTPGAVFVALRGVNADGARFVPQAIANGAIAVVAESGRARRTWPCPGSRSPSARAALAALAAAFYGNPSEELALVGITGTNGKTTTSYVLTSIFEAAGITCGRIGTIGYRIGERELDAPRTTPEAPELQRMLRDMLIEGCGACVMEVSSHALALRRADELRFAAGIFTNLTRDHLDFHGDMESYFTAKRRLFEIAARRRRRRDQRRRSARRRPGRGRRAARSPTRSTRAADVRPGPLHVLARRSVVRRAHAARHVPRALARSSDVRTPTTSSRRRPRRWRSTCRSRRSKPASAALEHVPGRFQVVSEPADDVRVIVDYAHTDDALKNLLETARPLATGRLVTVFGCGGDRDRTKRPLMGAVAARLSDLVIVTSDNPRSEDPGTDHRRDPARHRHAAPIGSRRARTARATPSLAIVDRREAIEKAVRDARRGDLVLIAGKGHEKYQVIGDRTLPFDDVEVARAALARRRSGSRVIVSGVDAIALTAAEIAAATGGRVVSGTPGPAGSSGGRSTRGRSPPAICSSRSAAIGSTGTSSSPPRSPRARPERW